MATTQTTSSETTDVRRVNYQSDFRVVFSFPDNQPPEYPWRLELSTPNTAAYNVFTASYDGESYHNCTPLADGSLLVTVDNHNLAPGMLSYNLEVDVPDAQFPDGEINVSTPGVLGIELWYGASDELTAEQLNVIIATLKGDPGVGVPAGGTAGQVLTKKSSGDYDTVWQTPSGGGGSAVNVVQTTGDSEEDVMSQKAVTDELDNRQTKPSVSGSEGQVLTKTGSGDDEVEWADIPAPEYAQETGDSEDTAMSQAAVTRELNSINSILNEQYSKIASFTASPSVVEKGIGAQSIKLSWRTTFNDQTITPDSLSVKKSTSETPLTTDKTLTTVTDSASADTTYTLEAVIKGVAKTAMAYARFYYPQFAGASASESLASADVLALGNKVVAASVARTVTMEVAQGQYFWFAVPENFSITSIKMGGFDVSLNAVATVAVDGRGNYKCYRSAKPQSAGSYTFEIK